MLHFQQELLSDIINGEDEKSCTQRVCSLIVHLLAWAVCLASIFMGAVGVHYLSEVGEYCAVHPDMRNFIHFSMARGLVKHFLKNTTKITRSILLLCHLLYFLFFLHTFFTKHF